MQPKTSEPNNVLVLYLHNNYIENLNNLETLYNLTHLYLQWNKISVIENLECLRNLKKLYLGYNNITVLEKLEGLKKLKELHIEKQNAKSGETICFDPRCLEALGVSSLWWKFYPVYLYFGIESTLSLVGKTTLKLMRTPTFRMPVILFDYSNTLVIFICLSCLPPIK